MILRVPVTHPPTFSSYQYFQMTMNRIQ
eukprot:COSAG02_NODE_17569_length_994_cov_1.975419_1_plen_27_part_10